MELIHHPAKAANRVGALPLTRLTPNQERYITQHWTMLDWAKRALQLGARLKVVEKITGVERSELLRLFFSKGEPRKSPGASPASAEWFQHVSIPRAVHVAAFYARFDKLRASGHNAAISLIKAYELYLRAHGRDVKHVISFDRAFDLVTHVDGIWTEQTPELEAVLCARCESLFITTPGIRRLQAKECPICKVTRRRCEARECVDEA